MDINEAVDFLSGNITNSEKELACKKLALSILTNTFQAEFKKRDDALARESTLLSNISTLTQENTDLKTENDRLKKFEPAQSLPASEVASE